MSPSLTKPSSTAWPLPDGSLTMQSEETIPKNVQPVYVNSPAEEATVKATKEEPARREQPPNQFPR